MTQSPALPVLLDGDPGLDDAVAWLLALSSPELKVLGITTVHGNVRLELTTRNAGVVLALAGPAGAGVPYWAGTDRPLVQPLLDATAVHGASGLPARDLPEPVEVPQSEHGVLALIRLIRARPGELTVIATGPLTNLGLAFRLAPDLPGLLRELVWMGGSTGHGNRTPAAEFNALADPHAAEIVFLSGVPLRMVGLNVTMQCVATPERLQALRDLGTRAGAVCAELLTSYGAVYRQRYGLPGGALHDPLAVAGVLRPDLLDWAPLHVAIDTRAGLGCGRTACDLYGVTGRPANASVAVGVREADFFALLLERLATLD